MNNAGGALLKESLHWSKPFDRSPRHDPQGKQGLSKDPSFFKSAAYGKPHKDLYKAFATIEVEEHRVESLLADLMILLVVRHSDQGRLSNTAWLEMLVLLLLA